MIFHYGQDLDPVVVECVARAFLNSGIRMWDASRWDDAIAAFDQVILRFRAARDPTLREVVAQAVVARYCTTPRANPRARSLPGHQGPKGAIRSSLAAASAPWILLDTHLSRMHPAAPSVAWVGFWRTIAKPLS